MWFYEAIFAAVISALYTITSKRTLKKIDSIALFWIVLVVSTPIVVIYSWNKGVPQVDKIFFLGIIGSVVLYAVSRIIFNNVIRDANLSNVYPLISLSPVFTTIFGFFILKEKLTFYEILGSLITLGGIYILNISSQKESLFKPFKILFSDKHASLMLFSVVTIGLVSVFDKLSINHTFPKNSSFTLMIQNFITVFLLSPWVIKNKQKYLPQIRDNIRPILLLGMLGAMSNLLILYALGAGEAGLVTSTYRIQVFFVLLFSAIIYKDKPKMETIIGTIIMLAGLLILKISP